MNFLFNYLMTEIKTIDNIDEMLVIWPLKFVIYFVITINVIIIIDNINKEYPDISAPKETSPDDKILIINDIMLAIINDL